MPNRRRGDAAISARAAMRTSAVMCPPP
jgi:hypothetical protein